MVQTAIENFESEWERGGDGDAGHGNGGDDGDGDGSNVGVDGDRSGEFADGVCAVAANERSEPGQFKQDLFSALQDAQTQNGSVDFSQVFRSFPPGTTLDTTA